MTKNELFELVENKVNEIYLAYQKAEGITSGDMNPDYEFQLDEIEQNLTDFIIKSMEGNMPMQIGDLVTTVASGSLALVTSIEIDGTCFIIYGDGSTDIVQPDEIEKTGEKVNPNIIQMFLNAIKI